MKKKYSAELSGSLVHDSDGSSEPMAIGAEYRSTEDLEEELTGEFSKKSSNQGLGAETLRIIDILNRRYLLEAELKTAAIAWRNCKRSTGREWNDLEPTYEKLTWYRQTLEKYRNRPSP